MRPLLNSHTYLPLPDYKILLMKRIPFCRGCDFPTHFSSTELHKQFYSKQLQRRLHTRQLWLLPISYAVAISTLAPPTPGTTTPFLSRKSAFPLLLLPTGHMGLLLLFPLKELNFKEPNLSKPCLLIPNLGKNKWRYYFHLYHYI